MLRVLPGTFQTLAGAIGSPAARPEADGGLIESGGRPRAVATGIRQAGDRLAALPGSLSAGDFARLARDSMYSFVASPGWRVILVPKPCPPMLTRRSAWRSVPGVPSPRPWLAERINSAVIGLSVFPRIDIKFSL